MISIEIKTWTCPECGYKQDFEPTIESMAIHFKGLGLANDECPACASGKNPDKVVKQGIVMVKETNSSNKIVMNIRNTDEEVEEEEPTEEDTAELASLQRKIEAVNNLLEVEPDNIGWQTKKTAFEQQYEQRKAQVKRVLKVLVATSPSEIQAISDKYED